MESNKNDGVKYTPEEQKQINDASIEEWCNGGSRDEVPLHKGPNRKTRRSKEFKNAQKHTAAAEAKRKADLAKLSEGVNLEGDNEKLAAGVNIDGTRGELGELC